MVPLERSFKSVKNYHRVTSSSVVRASDQITEGRGFESHLELGFFSESPLDAKTSCCISIKGSLGGWMVASLICLNVTARYSYESCVCLICLNVTA